ncbi:MAG: MFS transporter [Chloroflexi bacterium]|nr:MFS transporter [Chloroflexota bacterium]
MDPRFAGFPRRRVIWGQYFMSFSWSLGLWAAVPVIPILSLQLNENVALAGLVVSIGGAGRFFVSYITGPMLDRFGRRGIGAFGIFVRMVFSFLEGLSPTYLSLVAFRFGSGIGTSIWGAAHQTITADVSTPQDRGRISGRKQGWAQFGAIIGPVVGGVAWAATGDIRIPFFINGFSKMACLIVMLFIMVETRQLSERAAPAPSQTPAKETARPPMPYAPSYLSEFFIRVGTTAVRLGATPAALASMAATGFLYVLVGTFAVNLMRSTVQDLVLPVYVEQVLGLAESQLGIVIAAMGVGGLVASLAGGWATDRWGVQTALVPGAIVATAGLVLTAQGPALFGMVLLAVALGAAAALVMVGTHAFSIDVSPPGARGRFFGQTQAAGHFATFVGPFAIGGIADLFGLAAAFYVIGGIFLIMAPIGMLMGVVGPRVRERLAQEAALSPPR